MRIRGTYTSEEEMERKVALALANPAAFLQRSDPEYFLSHLEQAAKDIAELKNALDDLTTLVQTLSDKHDALAERTEELAAELAARVEELAGKEEEHAARDSELAARIEDLAKKSEELAAQNTEIAAQTKDFSSQIEPLRYAAMVSENTVWFSKKPLPRDGVARVLELKRETPTLTKAEVAARLKSEGLKMTDQEIRIVFAYYFGEF
jgi:chromosome segregation ATPase